MFGLSTVDGHRVRHSSRSTESEVHKGRLKMKYLVFCLTAILALGFGVQNQANAQTTQQAAQTQTPAAKVGAVSKKLGFRLTEWKTIHSHSEDQAKQEIATLKKIGCEVETANHGNHIDVKYRCAEWKALQLTTDQLVNQWATWCQSKGLETVVMNPPVNTQKATVKFRMVTPRTVHLHDATQAKQIVNTLELIGCQVATNNHGNHLDATFSSPDWITLELATDEKAHVWQKWLDESGFETQHEH